MLGKKGAIAATSVDEDEDDDGVIEIGDDADELKELGLGADKKIALSGEHKSLVPWIEK